MLRYVMNSPDNILRDNLPQGSERRLTQQLVLYWNELREEGTAFPAYEQLNIKDIQHLWDDCLLVAIEYYGPDYNHKYEHVGENIPGMLGDAETITSTLSLVDNLAGYYKDVVENGKVALREDEFTNASGKPVRYRLILLPMGHEERVEYILVGVRYKIYDATEETSGDQHE